MHIPVEVDEFNFGLVFILQSEFVWYTFMETYLYHKIESILEIEFGVAEMV